MPEPDAPPIAPTPPAATLHAVAPEQRLYFACRHRYPGWQAGQFELNATFEIGAGVTALVGPSGSGKSTTLAIIAGLLRPASGIVRLGADVWLDAAAGRCVAPERRRVGMVFQDELLFPHLTVQANLQFGARRRSAGVGPDFDRVVDVLELGDLLKRRPDALSGGQRRRVALGRAILSRPDLLLLDEPLSALDEALKGRILQYLARGLSQWRVPALFVSHDAAEVRQLADRTIEIRHGVVAAGE